MSDAIKNAIEAMEFAQYAVGPFHRVATKKLRDSIAGLKAAQAQASDPVAVADNGVLNWIDGKQFDHEADLYTAPPAASNGEAVAEVMQGSMTEVRFFENTEFGTAIPHGTKLYTAPPAAAVNQQLLESELTGAQWSAARKVFEEYANKVSSADKYEMASAYMDAAPQAIYEAIAAAQEGK